MIHGFIFHTVSEPVNLDKCVKILNIELLLCIAKIEAYSEISTLLKHHYQNKNCDKDCCID